MTSITRKITAVLVFSFILPVITWSQENLRNKPEQAWEKLKSDPELMYPVTGAQDDGIIALLLGFLASIYQAFMSLLGASAQNWDNIESILLFLSCIILVLLIIKLAGARASWIFGGKDSKKGLEITVSDEDIHSIDFDAEIAKAVEMADFRVAIRLLYLSMLKNLSDNQKIYWREGKTDYDYLLEIKDTGIREIFERVSLHFNYVWYGHFPASRATFEDLSEKIHFLNSQN